MLAFRRNVSAEGVHFKPIPQLCELKIVSHESGGHAIRCYYFVNITLVPSLIAISDSLQVTEHAVCEDP